MKRMINEVLPLKFYQRTNGKCRAEAQIQNKVSHSHKASGIKVQLDSCVTVFHSPMGEI